MVLPCDFDHPPADIDADAVRGLQLREQPSSAAAQIQYPQAFRHEEAHVPVVLLVVIGITINP